MEKWSMSQSRNSLTISRPAGGQIPSPSSAPAPAAAEADASAAEDDLNTGRRALFLDSQGCWREGIAVLSPAATGDISASLKKLGYTCDTFVEGWRDDDPALELWSAESPPAQNENAYLIALGGGMPRPLPSHLVRLCTSPRDYEVWIDRMNDALSQVERWLSIVELMRRIRHLDEAADA
jgi:hypothetical protein